MSTVCLAMIVKNESARIERCLRSALPYVDAAYIIDTGSTDDTASRIIGLMEEQLRDFHYYLGQRPWVDFATNRNEALAMAVGAYDYIILLDADHELVVGDPAFAETELLGMPAFNIWQEDRGYEYANIRLLRADVAAKYVGVTHEVLVLPNGIKAETLPSDVIRIIDHADGANRAGKYERDIALLEAELERSPDDARSVFYLAQSYRDLGELNEARLHYSLRCGMGGWEEEAWYAQYQLARLTERGFVDGGGEWRVPYMPSDVTHAYLMAYARRPWRAEPLWHLARYWAGRHEPALALMFSDRCAAIPHPAKRAVPDILFIESECYV